MLYITNACGHKRMQVRRLVLIGGLVCGVWCARNWLVSLLNGWFPRQRPFCLISTRAAWHPAGNGAPLPLCCLKVRTAAADIDHRDDPAGRYCTGPGVVPLRLPVRLLQAAVMVLASGDFAEVTAAGGVHGFPAELTSFIGRAGPVREVAGLLAEYRLVTVTGPGGAGKTRLRGQVAREVADRFADGVWLAELAPVRGPAQVAAAVAAALGVRERAGVPVAGAVARVLAQAGEQDQAQVALAGVCGGRGRGSRGGVAGRRRGAGRGAVAGRRGCHHGARARLGGRA